MAGESDTNKALKNMQDASKVAVGATLGADPAALTGLMLTSAQLAANSEGPGQTPWGATRYGDPGKLELEKDASKMPGVANSPLYNQFLDTLKQSRARTAAGTAAMLQGQEDTDPYAASRENALERVKADYAHEGFVDQQQMLAYRQAMALQKYITDLQNYEHEQALRNNAYDQTGTALYNSGNAIMKYFMGGSGQMAQGSEGDPWKGKKTGYDLYGPAGQGMSGANPAYGGPMEGRG